MAAGKATDTIGVQLIFAAAAYHSCQRTTLKSRSITPDGCMPGIDGQSTKELSPWIPQASLTPTSTDTSARREALLNAAPTLPQPNLFITIFLLVFKAAALWVRHEQLNLFSQRQRVQAAGEEEEHFHQEKVAAMKDEAFKAQSESRWSTTTSVFSWMTSFLQLFTGIALVLAGNPVAGALMIVAGAIQLTSHVMKEVGGWDKIAELLPGDNPEEKKALITWMQLGIGILTLIVGGAGGVLSGWTVVSTAMQTANLFTGSVALMGMGVCAIGHAVVARQYCRIRARLTELEKQLELVRERRRLSRRR
jgi:hypothetical protein